MDEDDTGRSRSRHRVPRGWSDAHGASDLDSCDDGAARMRGCGGKKKKKKGKKGERLGVRSPYINSKLSTSYLSSKFKH